ncbi:MAG: hypothetical protein K8R09_02515 [Desulfobacterales bacterium]|nr:hypothetical protein [Desulfobacterales bacterium]
MHVHIPRRGAWAKRMKFGNGNPGVAIETESLVNRPHMSCPKIFDNFSMNSAL